MGQLFLSTVLQFMQLVAKSAQVEIRKKIRLKNRTLRPVAQGSILGKCSSATLQVKKV